MARLMYRIALGIAAVTIAGGAFGQAQVYRYTDTDGRVVYSDRPPGGDVKNLQTKRMGSNFISTSEPGYAAALAADRFPVTLYTFACGEVCQNAEALLNKRGVPFTIVNVSEREGQTRLMALTNESTAPVLTVGDKLVAKGYSESRWQAMLDEAGYPKTPAPRRAPPAVRVTDVPVAAAAPEGTKAVGLAPRGGDYPK
jgi:glutaredoxin